MRTAEAGARPSVKQLRYLRLLAQRTGTTFTQPSSRAQASREIKRLMGLRRAGRPLPEPREADETGREVYGTAVRAGEVSGRGAHASWRHRRDGQPEQAGRKRLLAVFNDSSANGGDRKAGAR